MCAVLAASVFLDVAASANPPSHIETDAVGTFGQSTPEAPYLYSPEQMELYARIEAELKARNYSRPMDSNGARGVDISAWCGQSTWSCLKNNGYNFAIVREWQSVCRVDPNGVHSVANAWAAGIAHVDIYLFPSYTCGTSPASQVDQTIASMGSIPFGQLWFDVETGGGSGSPSSNMNWLKSAVNHAVSRLGANRVGIYSSQYMWSQVMGGATGPTNLPLWYAHYDNNPSFSDWRSFGGWSRPAMKQYVGDAKVCNFDVDLNVY